MKIKKQIIEIVYLVLVFYFFYEGIYKVANWQSFSAWLHHAPLLKGISSPLRFLIPSVEIGLAILLLVAKTRLPALYIVIAALLIYVGWIMSVYLFTKNIFWPWHALWNKPTWMQKMIFSVGLGWLAFLLLILSHHKSEFRRRKNQNELRNTPANAH